MARSLVGRRQNMLTVVRRTDKKYYQSWIYEVKCDCGNVFESSPQSLKNKYSCGCTKNPNIKRWKDITGVKKHKLTALRNTMEKSSNGDYLWEFQCECGGTTTTTIGRFNSGHTTSCGCSYSDSAKNRKGYHGMKSTKEYTSWRKMCERCLSPSCSDYPRYGGSGVTIHREWIASFSSFYEDMGDMPQDGQRYTLDRIDPTKNYTPDNCRWATNEEQARNKKGLCKANKTGIKGVHIDQKSPGNFYAKATWYELDGSMGGASFSFKEYGEEGAIEMAREARENAIERLQSEGAGYGDYHNTHEHYV